jgi:hypothetical protein
MGVNAEQEVANILFPISWVRLYPRGNQGNKEQKNFYLNGKD